MIKLIFALPVLPLFWLVFFESRKFRALRIGNYPEKREMAELTEYSLAVLFRNVLFSFLSLIIFLTVFYGVFRFFHLDFQIYANYMIYFTSGFSGFTFFACILFIAPILLMRLNYPLLGVSPAAACEFTLKISLFFCAFFSLVAVFFVYLVFSLSGGTEPDFTVLVSSRMPLVWGGAAFASFILFSNFRFYSFSPGLTDNARQDFLLSVISSFSGNAIYALMIFLLSASFIINSFMLSLYGQHMAVFGVVSLIGGILSLLLSFLFLSSRWKGSYQPEKFIRIFELSTGIYLFFMLLAVQQFFNSNMWFFLAVACGAFLGYILLFSRINYSGRIKNLLSGGASGGKDLIFGTIRILTKSSSFFLFIFALFLVFAYYCGINANSSILSDPVLGFAGINAAFVGFISVSLYFFFFSFLDSSISALKRFSTFSGDRLSSDALEALLYLSAGARRHSSVFFPGFAILAVFVPLISYIFHFRFLTGYQAGFQFAFDISYIAAIMIAFAFSFGVTFLLVLFLSFLDGMASGSGISKNPFSRSTLLVWYILVVFSIFIVAVKYVSGLSPQILFSISFIFSLVNVSVIIMVQSLVEIAEDGKMLAMPMEAGKYLETYGLYLFYIILFFPAMLSVLVPVLI